MGIPYENVGRIENMADAVPSLWNEPYEKIDRNFANLESRVAGRETGGLPTAAIVASNSSLDDYTESTLLYLSISGTYENMPEGCTGGFILVLKGASSGSPVQQLFFSVNRTALYIRKKVGETWSAWAKVSNDTMSGATSTKAGVSGEVPAPAIADLGKYLMADGTWGRDADVTAAKTAGQVGGAALRNDELDLNKFNVAGFYYLLYDKTYTNGPSGFTGGFLHVFKGASSTAPIIQICYSQTGRYIYTRRGNGTVGSETWENWVKTADAGILETAASSGQVGNAIYVAEDGNLDNYTAAAGTYYFGTSLVLSNAPAGVTNGFLTVDRVSASGPIIQRFTQSTTKSYLRIRGTSGSAWSDWRKEIVDADTMAGATVSAAGTGGLVPAPAIADLGKYLMADGTWGRDADVTAAKTAGQVGGAALRNDELDLNKFNVAGFYYLLYDKTYTNGPSGFTGGFLHVFKGASSTAPIIQICYSQTGRYIYTRRGNGTVGSETWENWVKTADAGILETAASSGQVGNAIYVAEDGNLDNYTAAAGTYYFGTSLVLSNAPAGVTNGFLTVDRVSASGPIIQRFTQSTTKSYLRIRGTSGSAWSDWRKEIVDADTMAGATVSAAGTGGLVPAPAIADLGKYLMADGTWGRDADVTAAKTAGQIGNVSQQTGEVIDLNNYKTSGSYLFSSAQSAAGSNFPATNLVTWLMVLSNGGSPTKQIAIIAGTNSMYQRYYAGTTWGPWVRIGVPFPQTAAGIGQWTTLSGGTWDEAGTTYTPADCVLPAGGSWAYFYSVYNVVNNYKCQYVEAGIAAGGTTLFAANAAREPRGFCWRIG